MREKAKPIVKGIEDKFFYYITDNCIKCGLCTEKCPKGAIEFTDDRYHIIEEKCIDCGTCSYICPVGAAKPV
ncbi:MAG: 4Fe-4S binding protein [Oscillospiraceae bacterium]|nr:4Fe-4S binding protein [Oscillospiraceae bacterium]